MSGGAPAGLGFSEARAAVDEGRVTGAAAALLVRGRLVRIERRRIERDRDWLDPRLRNTLRSDQL